MRLFAALFALFAMPGCFVASGSVRSGGLDYSANGFMGPSPMEMSAADLTSAQADRVRAEARALEAHPEFFLGWRGGYGGYYGYGSYGRVDPSYYNPSYSSSPTLPALEERARELEGQATDFERRLDVLEGSEP